MASIKKANQFAKKVLHTPSIVSDMKINIDTIDSKIVNLNDRLSDIDSRIASLRQFVPNLIVNEKTVITKIFTDLKMYLNPNDMAVAAHIALDGVWEKEITRAWITAIEPESVVLDVGANYGYYGLLAGQFTDRHRSKIIMFEANPKIIPYVSKSISINWLNETVKVENLAVSDKKEKLELTVLENYIGSSSVQTFEKLDTYMHSKMQLEINEKVKIKATSLDLYCREKNIESVDLIKMDIEGYEETAYEGMREIIKKSPKATLFIEFTKDAYDDPQKFYNKLINDFGYVYTINSEGDIVRPDSQDYRMIISDNDNWTMPIFSKINNLHKKKNMILG